MEEWHEGIPNSVRVGPFDVTIETTPILEGVYGHYQPDEMKIVFSLEHPNIQHAVNTLIHELTHAIYDIYECKDADGEERLVSVLALGWTQVYRDNLCLLQWIYRNVA